MKDLIEDLAVEILCAGVKIGIVCGSIYAMAWCMVGWL